MVRVTSARPSALRSPAPAKMTSCILPPRSVFALPSPMTQASASTTLDLPEPLGPTTAQHPVSHLWAVADAKAINPLSVNEFNCIALLLQGASQSLLTTYRAASAQARRTHPSARTTALPPNPQVLDGACWNVVA